MSRLTMGWNIKLSKDVLRSRCLDRCLCWWVLMVLGVWLMGWLLRVQLQEVIDRGDALIRLLLIHLVKEVWLHLLLLLLLLLA
jgi:hypothetical protein